MLTYSLCRRFVHLALGSVITLLRLFATTFLTLKKAKYYLMTAGCRLRCYQITEGPVWVDKNPESPTSSPPPVCNLLD